MTEIKLLKDGSLGKTNQIVNVDKKGAAELVKRGYAEYIKKSIDIIFLKDHHESDKLHFKQGQKVKIEKKGAEDLIKRGIAREVTQTPRKRIEEEQEKQAKYILEKENQEVKKKKEKIEIIPDKETAIKENKKLQKLRRPIKEILEETERPKIEDATLENVYNTTEKYLHINDRNRIDVILATAISNQLPGTPIWLFVVGNSGDWKSAFVRSLEGMPHVIKVDQLTKNTLASGKQGAEDLGSDLQHSNKILLFPDMAAITSMNKDEKNAIWGQFRNLYDGFINKRTGSGVKKAYEGCHVTFIACTTQAIRDEILIHAQLGTRELMYDTCADTVDNSIKMDKAWDNEQFEDEMQKDIQQVVCVFLTYRKIKDIKISPEIKKFLKAEAERLSILRASGMTDRKYSELINPVFPEVPTRLIKQFKRLHISLKSLDDNYSDEKCKEIISHIVDSSGNKVRQLVLNVLKKDISKWFKIPELQQLTKLGRKALKSQLEQLWNLDVILKEDREERIGGYVYTDSYTGVEEIRGGKIEDVSYYKHMK